MGSRLEIWIWMGLKDGGHLDQVHLEVCFTEVQDSKCQVCASCPGLGSPDSRLGLSALESCTFPMWAIGCLPLSGVTGFLSCLYA